MVGRKVQQYQFLEQLGAGGMGEIYRAQDTRLNRFVAIKVLAGSSSNDPDRRRRFVQEAQAASALNHPNIITIHDILTDDGGQFMVLEHIQGKTLADLIPKGGLRVPQVLKLAMQMTDALRTAHGAGIIHRDLKPGNVMVTDAGLVKVLDFGLAKLSDPAPITQDNDVTKTIADAPLTVEGSIIGTVSYMSPEQAEGKKVDTRSDIFSFGVVLYEMITGNRAFQADTAVGTLSMILRDSPRPILDVAPDVPLKLAQVVDRCLVKSPDDRFQTMRDVHVALGALKHESDSGVLYRSAMSAPVEAPAPVQAPPSSSNTWIVACAVALLLLVAGYFLTRPSPPAPVTPVEEAKVEIKTTAPAPPQEEVLTNDGIVAMVNAKLPLELIYSQIRNTPNNFNLSASEVIRLTAAKVPPAVIEAMRNPQSIPQAATILPSAAKAPPKAGETAKTETEQASIPAVAPAAVPAPAAAGPREVVVTDGSPFVIALVADVPEDAKTGAQLQFTVVNDVKVSDAIAIAKGATVAGEIAQGKRTFGKMTLRLLTVAAVDGTLYKIRALSSHSDKSPERPVETGVKPKNNKVVASAGTQYIAYADGDMHVTLPARGGK